MLRHSILAFGLLAISIALLSPATSARGEDAAPHAPSQAAGHGEDAQVTASHAD